MPTVVSRLKAGLAQGMCWGLLFAGMSLNATPDLIVNQFRLEGNVAVQTRSFAASDCAVVEGCTLAGARRLLLFDVGLVNIGDGDLVIGDPAQRPDLFHLSPCHGHYHMDGVAAYELLATNGQTVLTVRKQGFCFRDNTPAFPDVGEGKFTCDNQGLTVGWEDVYDKSLDCQWLDITGIPAGDYILRVVCNPDAILHESNLQNNVAEVLITLPSTTPPTNTPPKCVHHDDWKKWWDWKKLKNKFKGHGQKKCKIPRCTCKCHIPPRGPGHGHGHGHGDDDDDGKGHGHGHGKGDGHHDDDDDRDDDDDGKGGRDDDDDGHGGKDRDDDDDGKDRDDDDDGKDRDDDDGDGKDAMTMMAAAMESGKDRDDDDDGKGKGGKDKGKGKGKGSDHGKDKGKGKGQKGQI